VRAWNVPALLTAGLLGWLALPAEAASAKVMKVLTHYLDAEGRRALSPSLYERDAYQAYLRSHPGQRSGLRFDVQWKAPVRQPLTLRLELRGTREKQPTSTVVEATVRRRGWFSQWSAVDLTGPAYKQFGELRAWRATLWDGETLLGEQKSFLW
jgi:hypothetical protein